MWKKGRKKGVTLIELIIALFIFILIAIPVTNAIMQNIKSNNLAQLEKERVMAINYGYENLRRNSDILILKKEKGLIDLKNENESNLEYKGRMKTYIYKYELTVKENESYFTEKGTTSKVTSIMPNNIENYSNYEFESEIIQVSLNVYEKGSNTLVKTENYMFRSKEVGE